MEAKCQLTINVLSVYIIMESLERLIRSGVQNFILGKHRWPRLNTAFQATFFAKKALSRHTPLQNPILQMFSNYFIIDILSPRSISNSPITYTTATIFSCLTL